MACDKRPEHFRSALVFLSAVETSSEGATEVELLKCSNVVKARA